MEGSHCLKCCPQMPYDAEFLSVRLVTTGVSSLGISLLKPLPFFMFVFLMLNS